MSICYIFAAGEGRPKTFLKQPLDLVIAVDGGYKMLLELGITPDIALGDFDSLGFVPKAEKTISYPVKKDDTDTMLAVKQGLDLGFKTFCLYGGAGGRFDHTFANIQALAYIAEKGGRGYLFGEDFTATVIKNSNIEFPAALCGNISCFSLSEKSKISIKGLMYEGENITMNNAFPLGVSNEFKGEKSEIEVLDGMVLIILPNKINFSDII